MQKFTHQIIDSDNKMILSTVGKNMLIKALRAETIKTEQNGEDNDETEEDQEKIVTLGIKSMNLFDKNDEDSTRKRTRSNNKKKRLTSSPLNRHLVVKDFKQAYLLGRSSTSKKNRRGRNPKKEWMNHSHIQFRDSFMPLVVRKHHRRPRIEQNIRKKNKWYKFISNSISHPKRKPVFFNKSGTKRTLKLGEKDVFGEQEFVGNKDQSFNQIQKNNKPKRFGDYSKSVTKELNKSHTLRSKRLKKGLSKIVRNDDLHQSSLGDHDLRLKKKGKRLSFHSKVSLVDKSNHTNFMKSLLANSKVSSVVHNNRRLAYHHERNNRFFQKIQKRLNSKVGKKMNGANLEFERKSVMEMMQNNKPIFEKHTNAQLKHRLREVARIKDIHKTQQGKNWSGISVDRIHFKPTDYHDQENVDRRTIYKPQPIVYPMFDWGEDNYQKKRSGN